MFTTTHKRAHTHIHTPSHTVPRGAQENSYKQKIFFKEGFQLQTLSEHLLYQSTSMRDGSLRWIKMCETVVQPVGPMKKSGEKHSRFKDTIERSNKMLHFHPAVKQLTFMFTGALCYLWPLKACCLWVPVSAGLVQEWRRTEADHVVTSTVPELHRAKKKTKKQPKTAQQLSPEKGTRAERWCLGLLLPFCSYFEWIPSAVW